MKSNNLAALMTKSTRRQALRKMGLGAFGMASLGMAARGASIPINATETTTPYPFIPLTAANLAILDFALNLEYLEAQFYSYATTGFGIEAQGVEITGRGTLGTVTGPTSGPVPFSDSNVRAYALELAHDEIEHVQFLRGVALASGHQPIAMPSIDLVNSFNAAASAAGLGSTFSPFDNDNDFLLGAFIFEDVGVTAYNGAITSLAGAAAKRDFAGIMGTEAYHAGNIRVELVARGLTSQANAISAARDSLGGTGLDQGVTINGVPNIVPADADGKVFARTVADVLNIVYLSANGTPGGFFPDGVNA